MNTITSLFQQAQLAEASYANFFNNTGGLIATTDELITALTTGNMKFSIAQATDFVTHWRVVDQYTAPSTLGLTGSGFSATVFESLDNPGKYTFAVRGTETGLGTVFNDLIDADFLDIVADGIAIEQVIDMYNYWQSLTHLGVYQAAKLETSWGETATLDALKAAAVLASNPANPLHYIAQAAYDSYLASLKTSGAILNNTLGVITVQHVTLNNNSDTLLAGTPLAWGSNTLGGTAQVDVTGHSLGGHLAMAFSRLFPNNTTDVVAVNGAGFDYADPNVNALFTKLNGVAGFDVGKITNVVGTAGPYLTSQDWLFLQQPAGRTDIYTESATPSLSDPTGNTLGHGKEQMTDTLALYNLFAQLDPTLNTNPDGLQTITAILKAEANVAANTLESAITDLGKLFGISGTTFTGSEFDNGTTGRDLLYTALNGFKSTINAVAPTILSLAGMDAAILEANALTDPGSNTGDGIAYRYALSNGNPFVALGLDYSQFNKKGELDLYDATSNKGDLTEQYIADRAMMLQATLQANTADATVRVYETATDLFGTKARWAQQPGEDIYYKDYTTELDGTVTTTTVYQGNNIIDTTFFGVVAKATVKDMWQFKFGSEKNDTLTGGDIKENHLYGGAGDDILTSGSWTNYLEGGIGNDTLEGGYRDAANDERIAHHRQCERKVA